MLLWLVRRLLFGALIVVLITFCAYGGLRALRPTLYPGESWWPGTWHDLKGVFFHFRFGNSYLIPGYPEVSDRWRLSWAPDLWLLAGAMTIGTFSGIRAGVWCATRPRSKRSRLAEGLATIAYCSPPYFLGLGAILLFSPAIGHFGIPYFFDADPSFAEPWDAPFTFFRTMLVPWLILGSQLAAICLRLTLAQLTDETEAHYVRTAVAKGLTPWTVMRRHAAPPTYLATGSFVSISIPMVVTNAILIEKVFSIPGFFHYTWQATGHVDGPVARDIGRMHQVNDWTMLQALSVWSCVLIVSLTIVSDFVLVRLDPRVRAAGGSPG